MPFSALSWAMLSEVQEIAGAVPPLHLEPRLARGQKATVAFDGIAAKVAQITLTTSVANEVERILGVHEIGELAEIQSLVEDPPGPLR